MRNNNLRNRCKSADSKSKNKQFINKLKIAQQQIILKYGDSKLYDERIQFLQYLFEIASDNLTWKQKLQQQIYLHKQLQIPGCKQQIPSFYLQVGQNNNLYTKQSQLDYNYQNITWMLQKYLYVIQNLQKYCFQYKAFTINQMMDLFFDKYPFYSRLIFGKIDTAQIFKQYQLKYRQKFITSIINMHLLKYNTRIYYSITECTNINNKNPLYLILHQNLTKNQYNKFKCFKKIINQIVLLRMLEIINKEKNLINQKQQSYSINRMSFKHIQMDITTPIQFFIAFSYAKSLTDLLSRLGPFYIRMLDSISIKYNVKFHFLITRAQVNFNQTNLFYLTQGYFDQSYIRFSQVQISYDQPKQKIFNKYNYSKKMDENSKYLKEKSENFYLDSLGQELFQQGMNDEEQESMDIFQQQNQNYFDQKFICQYQDDIELESSGYNCFNEVANHIFKQNKINQDIYPDKQISISSCSPQKIVNEAQSFINQQKSIDIKFQQMSMLRSYENKKIYQNGLIQTIENTQSLLQRLTKKGLKALQKFNIFRSRTK